jgi:hypothetical protein
LTFEVTEDLFEVDLAEDLFAFRGVQEEGTAANVGNLVYYALVIVVDAGDKAVAEELVLIVDDAERSPSHR